MAKEQKYGIKFPITVSSEDKTLFDLNQSRAEMSKSEIMHLIFTPIGQRLRNANFGTRLIQFIFNPNDASSFSDVVSEIKEKVKINIPSCTIQDVEVAEAENGLQLFTRIKYTLNELDGSVGNYEIIAKL
jgi:phage baseplate assembly protein W